MRENGGKWGEMGGNGGKWGEMEKNGGKWEVVTNTLWKMHENVPTRKKNGGKWCGNGGQMGENGTRAGPIFPIFLKATCFPTGPSIKNLVSKYPDGKMGKMEVSGGIRKTGYFLGLPIVQRLGTACALHEEAFPRKAHPPAHPSGGWGGGRRLAAGRADLEMGPTCGRHPHGTAPQDSRRDPHDAVAD